MQPAAERLGCLVWDGVMGCFECGVEVAVVVVGVPVYF